MLIAVQAATAKGTSAALFYVLTYALMTIGAFAVVARGRAPGRRRARALRRTAASPGASRCSPAPVTLFLLAQAGVPLTGGFVAKLTVFSAAVDQRQYALALIGMLAPVIAAFVYLRIVLTMYAPADDEEQPTLPRPCRLRHPRRAHDRGRRGAVPRDHARAACSTSPSTPPSCCAVERANGIAPAA